MLDPFFFSCFKQMKFVQEQTKLQQMTWSPVSEGCRERPRRLTFLVGVKIN